MSDNNFQERDDRFIYAAKNFVIWFVCGTLFIVVVEMLLESTIFGVSLFRVNQDNVSQSLGQVLLSVAVRAKNHAVENQILWLPITIVTSLHTYLSGLPTLRRTFLIITAVIFAFLAMIISFAVLSQGMVDFNLLVLFDPIAAGPFCWWLTKKSVGSKK